MRCAAGGRRAGARRPSGRTLYDALQQNAEALGGFAPFTVYVHAAAANPHQPSKMPDTNEHPRPAADHTPVGKLDSATIREAFSLLGLATDSERAQFTPANYGIPEQVVPEVMRIQLTADTQMGEMSNAELA